MRKKANVCASKARTMDRTNQAKPMPFRVKKRRRRPVPNCLGHRPQLPIDVRNLEAVGIANFYVPSPQSCEHHGETAAEAAGTRDADHRIG